MKNWRELGEVPDSDDESFDDADFFDNENDNDGAQFNQMPTEGPENIRGEEEQVSLVGNGDIWSVPSSALEQDTLPLPRPANLGQASQILSQAPRALNPSPGKDSHTTPSTPTEKTLDRAVSASGTNAVTISMDDEISTNYVRDASPKSPLSSAASFLSRTPSPPVSPSPAYSHPNPASVLAQEPSLGAVEESRRAVVALERSLRPRKPIQQHPYILENAQYATFMKSHGVRPIRVTVESRPAQDGAGQEDSQDQDFQAEESQETSVRGHHGLEDSGSILFGDDEDELSLTPSLPKTSPHGPPLRTSSQRSTTDQTDATSVSDEEFPPLERLKPLSERKKLRILKRQRSQPPPSIKQKRARFVLDSSSQASPQRPAFISPPSPKIWDLLSSSPAPQPQEELPQLRRVTPQSPVQKTSHMPDGPVQNSRSPTFVLEIGSSDSPISRDNGALSNLSDGDVTGSANSSESESEAIRQNSRRIRGVLPASWLRIGQQGGPAPRGPKRRSPDHSPDRTARRGVALPRQGSPKPSSTALLMMFDETDDSDSELQRPALIRDKTPARSAPKAPEDDDGGISAMEEDTIDWMLPGRKRPGTHWKTGRAKKQRRSQTKSTFKAQPKITQALQRFQDGTASSFKHGRSARRQRRTGGVGLGSNYRPRKRSATPPPLSILDVVEPNAPRFVKIAARAVKKNPNLGKMSPSKKLISLATRHDNIDALSILRDWKSGKIKPKFTAPPLAPSDRIKDRPALREVSANISAPRPPGARPQKLVRGSTSRSFVTVAEYVERGQVPQPHPNPPAATQKQKNNRVPSFHPAQLEEEEAENQRRRLNARKRKLDAFYRRRRGDLNPLADHEPAQLLDVDFTLKEPESGPGIQSDGISADWEEAQPPAEPRTWVGAGKARLRKRRAPQRVNLEAPQYRLANDPLPTDISTIETPDPQPQPRTGTGAGGDKLQGLGPYGTHYTHHFDIFPFDKGVFFHESTLLGRGLVREAADPSLPEKVRQQRPAVSFSLDGRTLRWGCWDANTSSELGILVDWVVEHLGPDVPASDGTTQVVEAADFVLRYVLRSLIVLSDIEERAFVSRWLEVLTVFLSRFKSIDSGALSETTKRTSLEVLIRFCLATLAVCSMSRASNIDPHQFIGLEDLLKDTASATIRRLLDCGTEALQTLYGDLQRPTFRDRGVRSDRFVANCWVAVMRTLENASIPRSSFWEVTQSVMLGQAVTSSLDARLFERLWQDLFALLPLSEIDDAGLLVSGSRHTAPVEGWALPQQLLRCVFQLYQANPRQPPGFNDYCRALVGRCHFLVQQWGWRKCTGVLGTIFDFFGSQGLANLRNEEVYRSPRFLEDLHGSPSLAIEPEDRCFHIFIKLLALTIQRLKDLGRANDIKNLITRTLPNHDRQYLKEDTIHQHDLAALRNHHDLLCTLYWVSPPELRRDVHEIEKLVAPGSAHKEACLINVRAWNQLARFVMARDEGPDVFRPLAVWRNNVFNQVLDQYLSAASDIEQQFRALSDGMPMISKMMRDDMVAKNKATALDVLHFSARASLDVLHRAPTLGAALYGLSLGQLQKVFTALDYQSPGFDWGILRVALDTIDHLMGRIDKASEEQYSSEFGVNPDAPFLEEAVLLVNEHLTKDFFWMCRTTLAFPVEKAAMRQIQQSECAEKAVTLAARIAARFVQSRVTLLLPFFSSGKHALFSDIPGNLSTPDRKYLPLFIAVLVKYDVFDFKALGINILGMWMLSVVKPLRYTRYENYLAEVLKRHHLPFLERAVVTVGIPPDYNSNLDFFAGAIHHMRRTLRESASMQAKQHRDEFKKTLQLVMTRIKDDLALLRSDAHEHGPYIAFVRQVVSLIKSHGVNICAVDPFFLQPSVDYSPPVQDPQLHTAGIIAYGVRLSESDVNAASSLFHYLFNNFKISLGNDSLEQERSILSRAMRNSHVMSFMLQYMIPAAIQASVQMPACWALLEVYSAALADSLDSNCVSRELQNEEAKHTAEILMSIVAWFRAVTEGLSTTTELSMSQLHVMALLATIANTLQPSLTAYLLNETDYDREDINDVVSNIGTLFSELQLQLNTLLSLSPNDLAPTCISQSIAGAVITVPSPLSNSPAHGINGLNKRNPRLQTFASTIVTDVRQNWVVLADRVMVKMALSSRGMLTPGSMPMSSQVGLNGGGGGDHGAASLRGVKYEGWEIRGLLEKLRTAVGEWRLGGIQEREQELGKRKGLSGRARREVVQDELLF
ncbi:Mus7/MMS22 family-domain-containing protein [Dichotomopilus funicola]|uniref:Mus7/MMS22 family-domain-containing protein n=1 Tax=Dichotomopilus funicola TaxID=1934379 RepID=A0AAN6V3C9_9PEZI|nr:Mus7/MMS22 family-domain-containing protein [Dichotomopilus funicola]